MFKKLIIQPPTEDQKLIIQSTKMGYLFEDDINVIWGKNGIGKSTLLESIAFHGNFNVGYLNGGWSELTEKKEFEDNIKYDLIDIEWSGFPVFFLNYETVYDRRYFLMGCHSIKRVENAHNIFFETVTDSPSEVVDNVLKYLIDLKHDDIPILGGYQNGISSILSYTQAVLTKTLKDIDSSYKNYKSLEEVTNVNTKFRDNYSYTKQKPVLLFDQIDIAYDLHKQKNYFDVTLKELSKTFQIIVISNSIFALNYNVIDLDDSIDNLKNIL